MSAPLHRMPRTRIPYVAAIVGGFAAAAMAALAFALLTIGL